MRRRRFQQKTVENPKLKRDKKISEYYEKYSKLTCDSLSRLYRKDKDLIINLENNLRVVESNYRLFAQYNKKISDAKSQIFRCKNVLDSCYGTIKKKEEYDRKGFFGKLFSSTPCFDIESLKKTISEKNTKLNKLEAEVRESEAAIKSITVIIDGENCSPYDLEKLIKSLQKKISNASLRIDAQLKTLDYLQSKEAQIKERETKAALKVEHYTAYAAAYFDQTRKLAESVKRNLMKQEDILEGCPYCGGQMGDTPHADHIYPVSKGGLSTVRNMVLVCEACNLKKSNFTLRDFITRGQLDRNAIEERLVILGKDF